MELKNKLVQLNIILVYEIKLQSKEKKAPNDGAFLFKYIRALSLVPSLENL